MHFRVGYRCIIGVRCSYRFFFICSFYVYSLFLPFSLSQSIDSCVLQMHYFTWCTFSMRLMNILFLIKWMDDTIRSGSDAPDLSTTMVKYLGTIWLVFECVETTFLTFCSSYIRVSAQEINLSKTFRTHAGFFQLVSHTYIYCQTNCILSTSKQHHRANKNTKHTSRM